jgi:hypothetical protein
LSRRKSNKKSGRKFRTKLTVALATGICTVTVAGIEAYAQIHSPDMSARPSTHASYTAPATVGASTLPPMPSSLPPATRISSPPVQTPSPSARPSKPIPPTIQPSPVTPSEPPASTLLPTPVITPPNISLQIDVIGPCTMFNVCLPLLGLTLQPVVLENGAPVVSNCQVSWTVTEGESTIFQKTSSCQGGFYTGLVLGIGAYQIAAEATTGSGAETYSFLSLYVESTLKNAWTYSGAQLQRLVVNLSAAVQPWQRWQRCRR